MVYLTLATTARDEDDYIEEWVHYHRLIGFERFIIHDDRSKKPIADLFKGQDDVEVTRSEQWIPHPHIFGKHIINNRGKTKWIALLDIDHALVAPGHDDVKVLLQKYDKYAGLVINAHQFGSSGYITKPTGQIESFIHRSPAEHRRNYVFQLIGQPERCGGNFSTPHSCNYIGGYQCCTENFEPIHDQQYGAKTVSQQKIWVNHYYCRYKEAWDRKADSLRPDNGLKRNFKTWEEVDHKDIVDTTARDIYRRLQLESSRQLKQ